MTLQAKRFWEIYNAICFSQIFVTVFKNSSVAFAIWCVSRYRKCVVVVMPHESSSDAKAAKSQHAAQRRQTENAILCRWQGVDKQSARDIPNCNKFDFQLSSWSCLRRANSLAVVLNILSLTPHVLEV